MATAVLGEDGLLSAPDELETVWKKRISRAREDRRRYEPTWLSNLAYAAGKHHLVWDRYSRRLVEDPALQDRELYSQDIITEFRAAALGEMSSDDDRPELLLAQEGEWAEEFQKQINSAVAHGWEYEWNTDDALLDVRRKVLDLGVSAIWCYRDPCKGKPATSGPVPHYQGKPVMNAEKAHELMSAGPRQDVQMRDICEGQTVHQPLSCFNFLTPPGIVHERDFPWLVIVRPVPLENVTDQYADKAKGLVEDGDIGSILGISAADQRASTPGAAPTDTTSARLRGHVWLFTCFEMPTRKYPKGRKIVLATNQMKLLDVTDELPYCAPDGSYRHGVSFFHWWRLNDRFWSRSFIEPLKDPQRVINRRETQKNEIIDRGMPYVLVPKGSEVANREGTVLEVIEVNQNGAVGAPVIQDGVPPGDWFYKDIELQREHAQHASTLTELRLGNNPPNVDTYSQLALLNENEALKRQPILLEHKAAIRELVENSVHDIRTYWPPDKQIMVAGDEGQISREVFDATKAPDFYIVKLAKGAPKPRSQAAELQKVEDIARYSVEAGTPLPVQWFYESLNAGQAEELPEQPADDQMQKAQLENAEMFQGNTATVVYYDNHALHVQLHRLAQTQADMGANPDLSRTIEQHIQQHLAAAQQNALQTAAAVNGGPMGPPPAPDAQAQPGAPADAAIPGGPAPANADYQKFQLGRPPQGQRLQHRSL